MKSIEEAIESRRSVRSFINDALTSDVRQAIVNRCESLSQCLPGQHCRVQPVFRSLGEKIGSYGVIHNAQCWLLLIYKDVDAFSPVNAGMVMEDIVLWLAQRGLGTCWVGGTFSRADVARLITFHAGEKIGAMVAVGYPASRDSMLSRIMKAAVGSRKRKDFDTLFKVGASSSFRQALEMMRLAPSSYNYQPWRGLESPECVMNFYTASNNAGGFLNLGIALSHFRHFAPKGTWRVIEGAPAYDGAVYALSWLNN